MERFMMVNGNQIKYTEKDSILYQMVIRLNPSLPEPYHNIGIILARKRQWKEAERYIKKALFINPNFQKAKMDLNNLIALQKKNEN